MPPSPTLVCKECGYVNESARVYCHGCGAKLDRSVLIVEEGKRSVSLQQRQREVKKMMTPRSGSNLFGTFMMLIKTVGYAALAAALIQIIRPPEGVPEPPKKGEVQILPQIGDILEGLTAAPAGQGMIFREVDINTYLNKKPFRKVPAWFTEVIPLKRSFVNFGDGTARLSVQADLAGYPIYVGITAQLKSSPNGGGLTASCVGANIGRLSLPALVAQAASVAVPTLTDSVKRERQALERLTSAEITKGQIILRSRGPLAPAPAGRPAGH